MSRLKNNVFVSDVVGLIAGLFPFFATFSSSETWETRVNRQVVSQSSHYLDAVAVLGGIVAIVAVLVGLRHLAMAKPKMPRIVITGAILLLGSFQLLRGFGVDLVPTSKPDTRVSDAGKRRKSKAEEYSSSGTTYVAKGEYDAAITAFTQAITLNPEYAPAYYDRGKAYANLQEYGKAVTDYTEAITLSPRYAMAYESRGTAYLNMQEYEKAVTDYTEAITLNPKFALSYINRGLIHRTLGNQQDAADDLNMFLDIAGNSYGNAEKVREMITALGYAPKH